MTTAPNPVDRCPAVFPVFPDMGPACRLKRGHDSAHELNDAVEWTDDWAERYRAEREAPAAAPVAELHEAGLSAAERRVAELEAGINALADEWEVPVEGRHEYARLAFLCAADEIRALLEDA